MSAPVAIATTLRHVLAKVEIDLCRDAIVEHRYAVARITVAGERIGEVVLHDLAADPEGVAATPSLLEVADGAVDLRTAARQLAAGAPPLAVLAPLSSMRGAVLFDFVVKSEM